MQNVVRSLSRQLKTQAERGHNVGNVSHYTVSATSPCTEDATATVTVTEQAKPNAGTDGTLTVCAGYNRL